MTVQKSAALRGAGNGAKTPTPRHPTTHLTGARGTARKPPRTRTRQRTSQGRGERRENPHAPAPDNAPHRGAGNGAKNPTHPQPAAKPHPHGGEQNPTQPPEAFAQSAQVPKISTV
ncbi:hypothetical protein GCM10010234_01500 [Streptomyces hawaiiensis]